jgi:hypothetical protein
MRLFVTVEAKLGMSRRECPMISAASPLRLPRLRFLVPGCAITRNALSLFRAFTNHSLKFFAHTGLWS